MVLLWLISAAILFSDYKNSTNRWMSLFLFIAGIGWFNVILAGQILPFFNNSFDNAFTAKATWIILSLFSALTHYMTPYVYLLFIFSYSKANFNDKGFFMKYFWIIFLIPIIVMNIVFPIHNFKYYHIYSTPLWVTSTIYGLFVLIASSILLIMSYFKESNLRIKKERLFFSLIFIPFSLFTLTSNYFLMIFNIRNFWLFSTWIIPISFFALLIYAIKNGIMGFKIKLERYRIDTSIKTVSSGTAIVNHTLKNELSKIAILNHNIRLISSKNEKVVNNTESIAKSIEHVNHMIKKIGEQLQDIKVVLAPTKLCDLMDRIVDSLSPITLQKDIKIIKKSQFNFILNCDQIHMYEVLNNIITNAIEAFEHSGEISLDMFCRSNSIVISIEDNGKGIKQDNLNHIFDPYFTTKKTGTNFGLGLSYCFNVVKKHGGNIDIHSKENMGTTVAINLPKSLLLAANNNTTKLEVVNG